jgi:hypothetical protein
MNHIIETIGSAPKSAVSDKAKAIYLKEKEGMREAYTKFMGDNTKTDREAKLLDTTLPDQQEALRGAIKQFFERNNVPFKPMTISTVRKLGAGFIQFASGVQDLTYLALYLFQPALRSNFATMRITTKKVLPNDKNNYLFKRGKTMTIMMRSFKNAKSFGPIDINVYPELREMLSVWLSVLSQLLKLKKTPEFLIHYVIGHNGIRHTGNDDSMSRNIPRVSLRILGKDFNIDAFRKIWEIHWQLQPNYAKMTRNQRIDLHKQMLHTPFTAEMYNRK